MAAAEMLEIPKTTGQRHTISRRTFLTALAAEAAILALAFGTQTPTRVPLPPEPNYTVYPGWLEQNLGDTNVALLDRHGFVEYQSQLIRQNPPLTKAYSDVMAELVKRGKAKNRFLLGDSYQFAFNSTFNRLKAHILQGSVRPDTNPKRELVHSSLIVKGKALNWYGSLEDLSLAGIDISKLQKATDLYQSEDNGLITTAMPLVFGYEPNQIQAQTKKEYIVSGSGADHDPHITQHASLFEQIEYYRRYKITPTAPLPLLVAWYGNLAPSDLKAANRTSWLAGHIHEIIGTLKPSNWPIFGTRPNEGYFEVHGNAAQDLKANHFGRLISERLILLADQNVSFDKFLQNVADFFQTLNDPRYQSADTPATLDLPAAA